MTIDSMACLAAANPVPELPSVESPEHLRRLIEDDTSTTRSAVEGAANSPMQARRRILRGVIVAIPACIALSVVAVLLSSGSSGPGVNVVAAAYAASFPGSGTEEALLVARIFRGSQAGGTLRQREWLDSGKGLRRMQASTTGPYGDRREMHVLESVSAPRRWEIWSSGPEANLVTKVKISGDAKMNLAFGGISLSGVEGISLFRQLYRRGGMVLVGHERHEGRSLWKLESRLFSSGNAKKLGVASHIGLIVLVDPKTFLPVVERQVDFELPGHPIMVESDIVGYRRYGGTQPESRLFDLASQHPNARVRVVGPPKFVSLHKRR